MNEERSKQLDALITAFATKLREEPRAGWKSSEFLALLAFMALAGGTAALGVPLPLDVLASMAGTVATYIGGRTVVKARKAPEPNPWIRDQDVSR